MNTCLCHLASSHLPSPHLHSLAEDGHITQEPDALGVSSVDELKPRKNLPPLLAKLSERAPERLDYLGTSFGITESLLKFWKRAGFVPVYIRQTEVRVLVYLTILKAVFHCVFRSSLLFRYLSTQINSSICFFLFSLILLSDFTPPYPTERVDG